MIKVKICGITNIDDVLLCAQEGADALGFIFTKQSPRYINEKDAKKIITHVGPFVTTVGVFLDEAKEKVLDIAQSLRLDAVQFHGQESPAYCQFFKQRFKVIKTFFPSQRPFAKAIAPYDCDAFLFDVALKDKVKGVSNLSKEALMEIKALIKNNKRIIISGGLNVKNISSIARYKPYAVDVASGLEKFVGKKDSELVRLFLTKVKSISGGHLS